MQASAATHTAAFSSTTFPATAGRRRLTPPAPAGTSCCEDNDNDGPNLLQLDLGAALFQLLLHRLGVGLGHAFLHGLRSALDQVLGFLQAQTGDFAHDLDDVDLLCRVDAGEDDRELGLLDSSRR